MATKIGVRAKAVDTKKSFTAKELCEIIRQCKQDGVTELTLGDLYLSFQPKVVKPQVLPITPTSTQPPDAEISAEIQKQSEASIEQDALTLRQQQIDELTILNPLLAEQLIAQGELEIDGSDQFDE